MNVAVLSAASPLDARDVKSLADFVAIVSRYTRLRRSGRQYRGLCPFHCERHASLYVHPEKKIFYCFGCGAGGDLFDFIIRAEGCDFSRALRIVAGFSSGLVREREPRSGERFRAGVGASPGPAKQGISYSPESRAEILARLDATNRRVRAIEAVNCAASADLATACEPERSAFTCQKPDNLPPKHARRAGREAERVCD